MTDELQPLTETEKAYFDAIKQVARSARPADLSLRRMTLEGEQVAVIGQRVIDGKTAHTVGWQPLAIIASDEVAENLRSPSGEEPVTVDPDDLEGAAGAI